MKSIQMIGLSAPRFAVSASVVPAAGLFAAPRELATTGGHAKATSVSIAARVERIPGGGANADARPRTSVCRRSDL